MPKQQQEALASLINGLTKAEKRHFKLFSGRNVSGTETLALKLFDVIDRLNRYDEEAIRKRVPQIKQSQLANLRAKLYKDILVSLRMLHRNNIAEIGLRENLDFAQILYARGLYRQSLNLLDKTKAKALQLKMTALSVEITLMEKKIESQHITRSIDTRAEQLAQTSLGLSDLIHGETIFSNLSLQLYGLYLKMGHARNKQEEQQVKDFFVSQLPEYDELSLSFFEKMYLYQSFVWLYQLTQEFAKQYRYAQKWVDLFHGDDSEQIIQNHTPLYIKALHNVLNSLYLSMRYEKFVAAFEELTLFNADGKYTLSPNEASLHVMFTYTHKFNKHFLEGTFSEALAWVDELVVMIETNAHNWDDHRIMVFYYKIACTYFSAGCNEEAIEYLSKIINEFCTSFREDIHCFARILNLIAHYELGNDVLVSYQLKSVYRFLLKVEELNATHAEIFKFLRRTPAMDRHALRGEFQALLDKLLVVQRLQFEKRSGLYLDIISWLQSKIQGRPVQDVIREKFMLLEANRRPN